MPQVWVLNGAADLSASRRHVPLLRCYSTISPEVHRYMHACAAFKGSATQAVTELEDDGHICLPATTQGSRIADSRVQIMWSAKQVKPTIFALALLGLIVLPMVAVLTYCELCLRGFQRLQLIIPPRCWKILYPWRSAIVPQLALAAVHSLCVAVLGVPAATWQGRLVAACYASTFVLSPAVHVAACLCTTTFKRDSHAEQFAGGAGKHPACTATAHKAQHAAAALHLMRLGALLGWFACESSSWGPLRCLYGLLLACMWITHFLGLLQ